jgi:hypothetical protein
VTAALAAMMGVLGAMAAAMARAMMEERGGMVAAREEVVAEWATAAAMVAAGEDSDCM